MMIKYFFPAIITLLLVVCVGTQSSAPAQKAQKVKVSATHSLDMESLCKNETAQRYNTGAQKVDIPGLEQSQGNCEVHDSTFRRESFVRSFDANGQSLHLSTR